MMTLPEWQYEESWEFIPTLADLFRLDPRFEKYTRVEDEPNELVGSACWIWTGHVNWSGAHKTVPYGRIRRRGAPATSAPVYVHRYVWELFYGRYPRGTETHHLCKNTLCCNPVGHFEPLEPKAHDRLHNHVANLGFYARKKFIAQQERRLG
jgi:hypothetical protein